jgi:hypothetical protein
MPTHATAVRPAWAKPLSLGHARRQQKLIGMSPELVALCARTDALYAECLEQRGGHAPSGEFTTRTIPNGSIEKEICAHCKVPYDSGHVNSRYEERDTHRYRHPSREEARLATNDPA